MPECEEKKYSNNLRKQIKATFGVFQARGKGAFIFLF